MNREKTDTLNLSKQQVTLAFGLSNPLSIETIQLMHETITLYIDGGCSGSNQLDTSKRLMRAVVSDDNGEVLVERTESGGSNNIAEIWACYEALLWCKENGASHVLIMTDSKNTKLWVENKRCSKKINDPAKTQWLIDSIHKTVSGVPKIHFALCWIPREENLAGQYIEERYGL